MFKKIPEVLAVDKDKCVNCHACITACPVKYCNDAAGDYVKVNSEMCIGCGNCIQACTHEARVLIDDFDQLFNALKNRQPVVAIVAPAIAANFPNQYLNFNGWLKSIGVSGIFDVSFGAELTIKSYINHISTNAPKVVISQPCPAIVTYIEIYQPELIPFLAPADSPMTHTMKMIREYYPEFLGHKILIVSPCGAKKREFAETGIGDFNVTYKSFNKHIQQNGIILSAYPEIEFDGVPAERGVLFSTPGGLMRTAERDVPGITNKTRKIEGVEIIYKYLQKLPESIRAGQNPLLIDCLNCEMGCNGGPGTLNLKKSVDEIEFHIEERNIQMQNRYKKTGFFAESRSRKKIQKAINKYWKEGIYGRTYVNLSANKTTRIPTYEEQKKIYESMYKYSEKDFYNCSSCGYGNCESMALAIYNNLNRPDNCHFFKTAMINQTLKETQEVQVMLEQEHKVVNETLQHTEEMKKQIEERHSKNSKMSHRLADHIQNADQSNVLIFKKSHELLLLSQKQNKEFRTIEKELQQYSNMIQVFNKVVESINFTSEQINLLSLNASIESARAGESGKRFAVIASEIKELANRSKAEGAKITPYIESIKEEFKNIEKMVNQAINDFEDTEKLISEVNIATQEMATTTTNLSKEANLLIEEDKYFL